MGIIGAVAKVDEREARERAAKELGRRVQRAREALGVGTNELDRRIGVSGSSGYTSRLEAGLKARPSASIMTKVANELGVRLEWILHGEEPMRADASARVVERDVPTYSEAEVFFADALAAGADEKTIAAARVRLGRHRGEVTAKMAEEALREAISGAARIRATLTESEQAARVAALRRKP